MVRDLFLDMLGAASLVVITGAALWLPAILRV